MSKIKKEVMDQENEIMEQENQQENQEEKEQEVVILTDWKALKEKNNKVKVIPLTMSDGSIFGVEIRSLSKATANALNEKYESMKETLPRVFDKKKNAWGDAQKGTKDYIAWQERNKSIDNIKLAEMLVLSLVNKPEGNTLEEQIEFLQETLGFGQFDVLIIEVHKLSGITIDSKIEEAKNS